MSEIEQRPIKRDTGDFSGRDSSQSSPFDDLLREVYGQPSTRGTDVGSGTSVARGNDKTVAEKDAHFLDMQTGEIVGNAPRGLAGLEDGAPPAKASKPAEQKVSSQEGTAEELDEGEDFAILKKSQFPPKKEASGGGDEPDFDVLKAPFPKKIVTGDSSGAAKSVSSDKSNADDAAKKKFAGLPDYKPDASHNTKFATSMEKMTGWLDSNFEKIDADQNGTVTREELGQQMENSALANGEGGIYLATAYGAADNWKNVADELGGKKLQTGGSAQSGMGKPGETAPNVGITRDGLKNVRDNLGKFDSKELKDRQGSHAVSLQKSLESHTKHLASDSPVSQGQTGSCFVLAPVAAILEKEPTFFDDKIKDLGDGKLQVKLPDNEGRYGNVDTVISKPTDAERARFGGGETAAIVEKAFSQHLKTLMGDTKTQALQEQVREGGHEHKAISSMTGNKSIRTSPQDVEAKVRAELNLVNDANKGVTAGTHQALPEGTGLMHKHVYQVSGFDQKTGEVELTNPHKGDFGGEIEPLKLGGGARDGKLDGKFKISFEEFQKHFAEINTFDIRKK
ncbi:hypothetical protein KF728_24345 [Candidatus Obscuribacterales bacterium]|nr:hypothetical protein [Candidatus Obscuribacterales bacterium]MBX3153311.1 hypothetical protein [Candidatus Obscuribacterales bacterium]